MSEIPLIPRKLFFGNPDKAFVRISPDGLHLAYLAPLEGVLNVWVAPLQALDSARPVTHDTGRGIRFFAWAFTNQHILYIQDKNGDENWRLFSVELASLAEKDLTPFENVQTQINCISPKFPQELVIGLNKREAAWHDLYRANLVTGNLTLIEENERFVGYLVDDDYQARLAFQPLPDGGQDIWIANYENTGPNGLHWEKWDHIPQGDELTTNPFGFDKAGQVLYLKDSRGRDTAALKTCDLASKAAILLAEDPLADAEDVLIHPTEKNIQAVSFVYERKRWQILDAAIEPDLAYLQTIADGELEIASRSLDDAYWIALYVVDNSPVCYYLYDRSQRNATYLFSNRKELEKQPLVKMHSTVIQAQDGLPLVTYYSLPLDSDSNQDGIPDHPLPMVLVPHGGPWGRDYWGYDPLHQWLANRGYAVMCVNFRSSTGFGKAFTNAGDRQWGGRIIADQFDACQWAITQGIADAQQIAILGGSFGGYSTLAGLTFYPDVYACGVDLVGPSNLITLLETIPPYWKPMLEMLTSRIGDHRTEEGRRLLTEHSPLTYVERIRKPLLIGQGANDPRVKQSESDQIVAAMKAKNIPVTYLLYPDEGHGFARPENNLSFFATAEAFLARQLEGRYEPIGDDFANSSLQVIEGAGEVPGLKEHLES